MAHEEFLRIHVDYDNIVTFLFKENHHFILKLIKQTHVLNILGYNFLEKLYGF